MKNVIKSLFACAAVALLITSCSKETNCVNNITGSWTIATMTALDSAGNEVDLMNSNGVTTSGTMEFTKYNTASADEKGMIVNNLTISGGGLTQSLSDTVYYRISEDCGQLWSYESMSATTYEVITINELTASSVSISNEDETLGTITVTATK